MIAIVLFRREVEREGDSEPDLTAVLWMAALRTRVTSSVGERSAIESRCRGANGEVCGDDGVE